MAEGRYVAYYRVSPNRQGRSSLGLSAQKRAVRDYLRGEGRTTVGHYTEIETGKGGSTLAKRPQLQAAIAHAKTAEATLLIAQLDRLARNAGFIGELMESGVEFVACDRPSADKVMLRIYAAMAEEEDRRVAQQTKAALAAARARGVRLGRMGKVRAQKNKAQARAAAEALRPVVKQLQAEGIVSVRALAEALNQRGIATTQGGQWHPTSVQRLLKRLQEAPLKGTAESPAPTAWHSVLLSVLGDPY